MFGFFLKQVKPFQEGYLPEHNGHRIYYHVYGNPAGIPILVFHGGPGSHSKPHHTDIFDLKRNQVILFDQRGRGKSTPLYQTENNTLADTVGDAQRILQNLNIEKSVIYGESWGSTVALVFAETYPNLVERLIVAKTFLGRQKDVEWIFKESARFYPDIMHEIMLNVPIAMAAPDYYAALSNSTNKEERIKSLNTYGRYEHMIGKLSPSVVTETPTDAHLGSFGIRMHYEKNRYFLEENQILKNIGKIAHIPVLIVHNRLDMICPVEQSWALHQCMKISKLVIVPESGHDGVLLDQTLKKEISSFLES